jgi:hypothetical protein
MEEQEEELSVDPCKVGFVFSPQTLFGHEQPCHYVIWQVIKNQAL